MPDQKIIVVNTTPLLALTAGLGHLDLLQAIYTRVHVPCEVVQEVRAGGRYGFAVDVFEKADWLHKISTPTSISPYLKNSLDPGEASVIQTALDQGIPLVCIDEAAGRRIARICGLQVTGSIGILLKAKQQGYPVPVREALDNMQRQGIWLSRRLMTFALQESGGSP
mgnify:CR=1 FL=1